MHIYCFQGSHTYLHEMKGEMSKKFHNYVFLILLKITDLTFAFIVILLGSQCIYNLMC